MGTPRGEHRTLALEKAWKWAGAKVKMKCLIFEINKEMERMELDRRRGLPLVHWPAISPWILPPSEIDARKSHDSTAAYGEIGERLRNT